MSSPAVVSSAGASLAADHGTFKLNAEYLADLDIAWQKVNNHPVFQGLAKLSIPPIPMHPHNGAFWALGLLGLLVKFGTHV